MGNEFKDKYKVDISNDPKVGPKLFGENQQRYGRNPNTEKPSENKKIENYKAPKGTARKAKRSKKRSAIILASILAATIGVVGITDHTLSKVQGETPSITGLEEPGINHKALGLSQETFDKLVECEEYFEKDNTHDLMDGDIIDMIDKVEELHFSVVKEKIGKLLGKSVEDIKMYYCVDRAEGLKYAKVEVGQDIYCSSTTLFGIGDRNTIPNEIKDVIWQLDSLNKLEDKLIGDKISKINAVKELKIIVENLVKTATGKLTQDKNGNINIEHNKEKSKGYDIEM